MTCVSRLPPALASPAPLQGHGPNLLLPQEAEDRKSEYVTRTLKVTLDNVSRGQARQGGPSPRGCSPEGAVLRAGQLQSFHTAPSVPLRAVAAAVLEGGAPRIKGPSG